MKNEQYCKLNSQYAKLKSLSHPSAGYLIDVFGLRQRVLRGERSVRHYMTVTNRIIRRLEAA